MDSLEKIHAAEVDEYTDAVMKITADTTLTDDQKRTKVRSLIEWLT